MWSFSIIFDFERNYDVSTSKGTCILLNKNINFNKNKTESKMKNRTHILERQTLGFSSYKNRKLKVKLWWVGARARKRGHFLLRWFCLKEIFVTFFVISLYSVSRSEYTYSYLSKNITLYTYCLFLKLSKVFNVFLKDNLTTIWTSLLL